MRQWNQSSHHPFGSKCVVCKIRLDQNNLKCTRGESCAKILPTRKSLLSHIYSLLLGNMRYELFEDVDSNQCLMYFSMWGIFIEKAEINPGSRILLSPSFPYRKAVRQKIHVTSLLSQPLLYISLNLSLFYPTLPMRLGICCSVTSLPQIFSSGKHRAAKMRHWLLSDEYDCKYIKFCVQE